MDQLIYELDDESIDESYQDSDESENENQSQKMKNHRIKMKNKRKKTLQQPVLLLLLKGNSVD